jgi:ankyrin repeat protein
MDQWNTILRALQAGQIVADKNGENVLSIAIINNAPVRVINKIIDIQPEFSFQVDKQGNLPIHYAVSREPPNEKIISKLYSIYPDSLYIKNKQNRTPFNVIQNWNTVQFLERQDSHRQASSSSR